MKTKKLLIRKVWKKNNPEQKVVTIPNTHQIEEGDYVKIEKVE